jgi:hypothetical protein
MSEMRFSETRKCPVIAAPEEFESLIETISDRKDFFRERLLDCGALLFRGCRVENAGNFERFVRHFSKKELFNYAGGVSPRIALGSGVYTSTEYPEQIMLSLHNELSYADIFPEHIYFCCLTAPKTGGETTIGDSRRILQKINPEIVERFKRKNICYIRNLSADKGSGYSWQEAFETDCRIAAENRCRTIGASFEWKNGGGLRLRQIRPATLKHPLRGEEVWFNQADGFHPSNLGEAYFRATDEDEFRLNCRFGDDSTIDSETLRHIREVLESETIPHKWQVGDILILDNLLTSHGRLPFSGERKIAAAMT